MVKSLYLSFAALRKKYSPGITRHPSGGPCNVGSIGGALIRMTGSTAIAYSDSDEISG
jgi:hypothetical protein